jgi:nitrate/TMAO reductase-like tetraheme cytochrome c subunit
MSTTARMTPAERILKKARENPSRTCRDHRQIDLFEHAKQAAFARLDQAIKIIQLKNMKGH